MALGDYEKTIYVNGQAPGISAQNLNRNENKTEELDTTLAAHLAEKATENQLGHVKTTNIDAEGNLIIPEPEDKSIEGNDGNKYTAVIGDNSILVGISSINLNYDINTLAEDKDYVYVGVMTYGKVIKLSKPNLTVVAESADLGSYEYDRTVYDIALDDNYIYVGGQLKNKTVRKLLKSDLSQVAESAAYGNYVHAILEDGDYIYIAGRNPQTVRKILKSDMSTVANSASFGGDVYALDQDTDFIYVGGMTNNNCRKILKTDLSQVAESTSYGHIYAIVNDNDYVYIAGGTGTVRKLLKSDMSVVENMMLNYTDVIWAMFLNDNYIYVGGGSANGKIIKLLKTQPYTTLESSHTGYTIKTIILDDNVVHVGGSITSTPKYIYVTQYIDGYEIKGLRRITK